MSEHGARTRRAPRAPGPMLGLLAGALIVLPAGCLASWRPPRGDPPVRPVQSEPLCLRRVEPFLAAPSADFDLAAALLALSADVHENLLDKPYDARAAQTVIEGFLAGCESSLGTAPDVEGLTHYLFGTLALEPILTPSEDTDAVFDVTDIFPERVLQRGRGACLGLSALYLIAARRFHLPIAGVLVNTHFFVRDEGRWPRMNIETLRRGHHHTDSYYARRFGIPRRAPLSLRSLDDAQSFAAFLFNVANAYRDAGRAHDATRIYERVLEMLPAFAEARGNMATLDLESGGVELAIDELNATLRAKPTLERAYVNLCVAYARTGDLERAEAVCRAGVRVAPQNAQIHHALGTVLHAQGRLSPAIESYRRAVAFDPNLAAARTNLARAYAQRDEGAPADK